MDEAPRPSLFYLFRKGTDIVIREMTDLDAEKLWRDGVRWLDIPRRTMAEAQDLRLLLLGQHKRTG